MIGNSTAQSTKAFRRVVSIQSRGQRTHIAPFKDKSFGPGGRTSVSGITATVFGAYGFVGRYFLNELGRLQFLLIINASKIALRHDLMKVFSTRLKIGGCGSRVYAPFRGCEMEVRHLKPMFDVGQLGLMPFSTRDEESVRKSLANSDIVINLIGKHYETKHIVPTRRSNGEISRINYGFEEVNVDIPRNLARLAKEAGVTAFVHLSALSADIDSTSKWSQSKARGEIGVREEFPDAIIVRPATVFGAEDRFLNWIAEGSCRMPFFPLINDGNALVQPIYCGDLGKALMAITYDHDKYRGKTFQLAGPAEYSYKEVVEFVHDLTNKSVPIVDIPIILAKAAGTLNNTWRRPFITEDVVNQMQEDCIEFQDSDMLTMKDLGIEPVSMDKMAFSYLHRFRPGGHFVKVQGYYLEGQQGQSDAKSHRQGENM